MEESKESNVNRDGTVGPSGDPGRLSTVESFHQNSPRPASLGRYVLFRVFLSFSVSLSVSCTEYIALIYLYLM